jgi:hypothetical protein
MGTLNPPSDGDDIAKVTPRRRREGHLAVVPTVRDPLPAETSVWDTDEPVEPPLRRSRRRQLLGALMAGWRSARSLLTFRPLSVVGVGTVLACVAAISALAVGIGSGPAGRAHRTLASSLVPHGASSAKVSDPAAHPAHRPSHHQPSRRVRYPVRHRQTSVNGRRSAPKRGSARASNRTQGTPTTTATQAPSTPVSSTASTSSTAGSSSDTSQSSRRAGPSGSGAVFGPGY